MSENRIYYSRSAEMRAKQEQTIAMILFMLLGVAIGTLLALLFTPISGSRARQEIANALEDGFDSGRHASQRAIESLEDQLKELRKRVEDRLG